MSDALAYTYQQDGHAFYVLIFPSAETTWVFDAATNAWHERAALVDGRFRRHRSNCQARFNAAPLVGDFENGNLYALDLARFNDNGAEQKWLRSWRALAPGQNDMKRTLHRRLQLDCQTGVGLSGSGVAQDPQMMLRWSDDGGHTWSYEYWRSMGRIGRTETRVLWNRLGATLKSRDRVYEVSGADPVIIALMGAELTVEQTDA
jgi:hypothetical protein